MHTEVSRLLHARTCAPAPQSAPHYHAFNCLLPVHLPPQVKGVPEVFGLVHKSEVTWDRILTVDQVLRVGEWTGG